ncbi:MAG: serine hydroxymethyltransferase [Clostridia bacterium]|nr:serine hydroxymethyltransferase [Clostridia bacterium]
MDKQVWKLEDPELAACLANEEGRQRDSLEMIASESIQPPASLILSGSAFANKTAVGNPGKQRLKGSQYADELERLAAERACELFGADHAIMTPYSGSVANYCAFAAFLSPGDRVLAMDPAAGAHQTHGGLRNISSRLYKFSYFGLDKETMLIDYAQAAEIAEAFKPNLMVVGSASYSRKIDYERLAGIAHDVGAVFMVDLAHFSGLAAAGISPNPVLYADVVTASTTKTMCGPHSAFIMCREPFAQAVDTSVYPGVVSSLHLQTIAAMCYTLKRAGTEEFRNLMQNVVKNARAFCEALKKRGFGILSGGTDCHMFVADLRPFDIDCERFACVMEEAGISVNTKAIPFDPSPVPRGIRAGTTVLTQRGMGEKEMEEIADLWLQIANDYDDPGTVLTVKDRVKDLAKRFPLPE